MTAAGPGPGAFPPNPSTRGVQVDVIEGTTVNPTPEIAGARPVPGVQMRAILRGRHGAIRFDDDLLSKHVLFLGGIGTGKTNAMMQLLYDVRRHADPDDVFVIFDSKGDFLSEFYQDGDAVISNVGDSGRVEPSVWNVFLDIGEAGSATSGDDVYEMASTIFGDELSDAGQNMFFAAGARDLFAAVFEAMTRDGARYTNADLRRKLEGSNEELYKQISAYPDLSGTSRYLRGSGNTPESIRAFLQQSVNSAFSGVFRQPGDFSVRSFVRQRQGRALFVEYDIATGSRLTPVYRVLIDLAIKEALTQGRGRQPGSVYFVMDEFSLVPLLQHLSDGINFGRSLGLKFIVGTQNVEQVLFAYGLELGRTIMSGFGTVFAFRLMDDVSRELVRQRFGANRKQITIQAAVRAQGVRQETVLGNVVEDWVMSALTVGQCIASLPVDAPFSFAFNTFRR
jgi:hypothetical protein